MGQQDKDQGLDGNIDLLEKPQNKLQKPKMFTVVFHNDDYTPRDFVVGVLVQYFKKTEPEATQLMLQVHNNGNAAVGIYPFEIAESKCFQVLKLAKSREFPLRCTIEESNP